MAKLAWYKQKFNPAYIQDHVQAEMELRVVVVNYNKTFGYRRKVISNGARRSQLSGGAWQTDKVPAEAIVLAKNIAQRGDLSDVAVEIIASGSQFWVLELNFEYDNMGDFHPGLDRLKTIKDMIKQGEL
jgi:glutathione synthase/RimK-type ligase-like ATP-grasp enzyme